MGIFPNPFISGLVTDRVYTLPIYLTINLKAYTCTRVYPATREIIMSAYIIFTESVIYFTPNSTTLNSHGHVAIKVVTPRPFLHKHQYNTDTGRHEIAVHIPINYGEKFWVFVYLDNTQGRGFGVVPALKYIQRMVSLLTSYPSGKDTPRSSIQQE